MLKRLLLTTLLCFTGWVSSSNASLIGVCTYSGGNNPECTPDFSIGVSSVNFDYLNNGTGTLTINGLVGNATFADGQLQGISGDSTHTVYGALPPSLGGVATDDIFSLTATIDTSGAVTSSNITMNGRVGFNPAVVSANGTTLDGNLITGATIDQLGWISNKIDFTGIFDASSLLYIAGFEDTVSGLLSITSFDTGSEVVWNSDWSSSSATLDVVVPVPAAFWLFLSGLTALISTTRRRKLI